MHRGDIFDRIINLSVLGFFIPFYKKYKQVLLYLFFGGLAFVVSVVTFALFNLDFGIGELIANVLSWIITVTFAFFTNRIWVFNSPTSGIKEFLKQMSSFFGGRVITLVIEEMILLIFITWMEFPSISIKVIAQVIVIVLNYAISKLLVFKN